MIVREKELNKIVKDNFYLNNVLLEMEGVLNCNIYFINAVCKYKYKTGILIIFDMLNSINIDLASQYEMIFDEEEKYLKIRLDNGQDLKLSVINNKKISIFTRQICKCVL